MFASAMVNEPSVLPTEVLLYLNLVPPFYRFFLAVSVPVSQNEGMESFSSVKVK